MKSPLHLLEKNQTKLWLLGSETRRSMASQLRQKYPTGCGVLSWTGYLIALVDSRGAVTELAPPFHWYSRHDIANKPELPTCPCANFYDPESQGPWKLRNSSEHHPLCQFDRASMEVYNRLANAHARGDKKREDDWTRTREEVRGERGAKTGPRTG